MWQGGTFIGLCASFLVPPNPDQILIPASTWFPSSLQGKKLAMEGQPPPSRYGMNTQVCSSFSSSSAHQNSLAWKEPKNIFKSLKGAEAITTTTVNGFSSISSTHRASLDSQHDPRNSNQVGMKTRETMPAASLPRHLGQILFPSPNTATNSPAVNFFNTDLPYKDFYGRESVDLP